MIGKKALKVTTCCVLAAHLTATNGTVLAAARSEEQDRAMWEVYSQKISRGEREVNLARSSRDTWFSSAVGFLSSGAAISYGGSSVTGAIDKIQPLTAQGETWKKDALDSTDQTKLFGTVLMGLGGLALIGYLVDSGSISEKQAKVDQLRAEMNAQFAAQGLTPEYLKKNERLAATMAEIERARKSAASSRSYASFLSEVTTASIVSGAILMLLSKDWQDSVESTEFGDSREQAQQSAAVDDIKSLESTGVALLGIGAASAIATVVLRLRASSREERGTDLENSLLQVSERLHVVPQYAGLALMYTF